MDASSIDAHPSVQLTILYQEPRDTTRTSITGKLLDDKVVTRLNCVTDLPGTLYIPNSSSRLRLEICSIERYDRGWLGTKEGAPLIRFAAGRPVGRSSPASSRASLSLGIAVGMAVKPEMSFSKGTQPKDTSSRILARSFLSTIAAASRSFWGAIGDKRYNQSDFRSWVERRAVVFATLVVCKFNPSGVIFGKRIRRETSKGASAFCNFSKIFRTFRVFEDYGNILYTNTSRGELSYKVGPVQTWDSFARVFAVVRKEPHLPLFHRNYYKLEWRWKSGWSRQRGNKVNATFNAIPIKLSERFISELSMELSKLVGQQEGIESRISYRGMEYILLLVKRSTSEGWTMLMNKDEISYCLVHATELPTYINQLHASASHSALSRPPRAIHVYLQNPKRRECNERGRVAKCINRLYSPALSSIISREYLRLCSDPMVPINSFYDVHKVLRVAGLRLETTPTTNNRGDEFFSGNEGTLLDRSNSKMTRASRVSSWNV
uniref:Uncharacterized protein n=1 Tax=Vespula pensylvanica TaxID=30213 RepID=A0A834U9V6_VESPE|nr:hypothetical protein H0235_007489 [Vespula pensylvanica]